MVRESLNARQQAARTRRGHFISLAGLLFLLVVCILALSRGGGHLNVSTSSWKTAPSSTYTLRDPAPAHQNGLLPNLVAATRNTLDLAAWGNKQQHGTSEPPSALPRVIGNTLVLYLYSAEDKIHRSNFRYFLRWGLADVPGLDYLFVIRNKTVAGLPALPGNARYWNTDPPGCVYGMGILGEALKGAKVDRQNYQYYILTGSYVRGPFLPTFTEGHRHWSYYFLQHLQGHTKLVGPTISCQDPEFPVNATSSGYGAYTFVPYVQFLTMATDSVGLALLEKDPHVFQCFNETKHSRFGSERSASRAILAAGYTIDSFLMRYRGIDWTNISNWECNARLDPTFEWRYDGISINPFEVMFVPMDLMVVENGWSYAKQAAVYDSWLSLQDARRPDVLSNVWEHDSMPIRRQRIAYVQSRGPGCFDTRYYLAQNKDLAALSTPLQLWDHFVTNGQFEARSFRWSCEDERKLPWEH